MVRFNTIIPTKYWCEKLRMSSNGQSLIRLQAVIPSGEYSIQQSHVHSFWLTPSCIKAMI